jgi:hypothetical protein
MALSGGPVVQDFVIILPALSRSALGLMPVPEACVCVCVRCRVFAALLPVPFR